MKQSLNPNLSVLKILIAQSRDAGDETKRALLALIDASEDCTKAVYYTGYSKDIDTGIHDMCSSNTGSTFLHEVMKRMGVLFRFYHFDGYFSEPRIFLGELKPGEECTHTIFFSKKIHDWDAHEVSAETVEAIQLEKFLQPM